VFTTWLGANKPALLALLDVENGVGDRILVLDFSKKWRTSP